MSAASAYVNGWAPRLVGHQDVFLSKGVIELEGFGCNFCDQGLWLSSSLNRPLKNYGRVFCGRFQMGSSLARDEEVVPICQRLREDRVQRGLGGQAECLRRLRQCGRWVRQVQRHGAVLFAEFVLLESSWDWTYSET